ncbi:MAG TPA: hypothetical protein VFF90_07885 [Saprospiraceae bacterium]|nr:hypothetical protein [Saprospiraceae bacterium]
MPYKLENIEPVLREFQFPTVMMWNRVEGRPRATKNFDRALQAEVRDALWMLTKQWQMGEFEGDDAGSPVLAKIRMDTTRLTQYQADSQDVQAFPDDIPLEAKVEQKQLPGAVFRQDISLDLRLMAGRRWKRILTDKGILGSFWNFTLEHFAIALPDPTDPSDAAICAHPDAWQQVAAVAGRASDGLALYQYVKQTLRLIDLPGGNLLPNEPVDAIGEFVSWMDSMFLQPLNPEDNAWIPSRLEYQFQCSAPLQDGEKVLAAKEYYQGHLDWYNFNIDPSQVSLGGVEVEPPEDVLGKSVRTMLPTPVMFDGMPNTRWWAFENGNINYNFIKPGTQELAKLMFMEFGLVYANDWYLIPFDLPVGTIAKVRGMAVSNVFGENFWIEASGRGSDEDWDRWNMFSIDIEGHEDVASDTSLLLLPSVPKIQESKPLEKVVFIRDEMANMVWGIETIIPLAHGDSVSGNGAAAQYQAYLQRLVELDNAAMPVPAVDDDDQKPKIRYEIMNQVPENWIPFIPVHLENDTREVQLQRAAMPRFLKGDVNPPAKVRPRTTLLMDGLAQKLPFYIYEEEVPREGAVVYQSYQRTRWKNGKVFIWFGSHKTTGRGEGSSGLAFDRILANT